MKAFVVDKYKKKGALLLVNRPEPQLHDSDVLIRIHATGVNLLDSKVRDGEFSSFLHIVRHSFWGTMSPELSSRRDPR